VSVAAGLQASFFYVKSTSNSFQVSFNGTASTGSPTTFTWDYGDGTVDSGAAATFSVRQHTYPTNVPTTYQVRLTVADSAGRTSTAAQFVPVP
jgi:PKD repeat protein